MKQLLTNQKKQKLIGLSLGVAAMATGVSSVQARTINAEVGPIFSSFFAKIPCEQAASKLKGKWNGKYWKKPGTINGVCQIVVPDPVVAKPIHKPIRQAPIKPSVRLLSVDAGRLWNQAHADWRCPQLAKQNNGRWTKKWSEKTADKSSYCQVEVVVKPVIPPPSHKIMNVKAGRIWSPEHAKQRCPSIAKQNDGSWTGKWSTEGNVSSCQIKVAIKPPVKPVPLPAIKSDKPKKPRNVREVSAGRIWDQAQANRKCPLIATQTNGEWTSKWRKTGSNNEAVCEIRFEPLEHGKQPPAVMNPIAPAPTRPVAPPPSSNTREVPAGPIWDQAQASKKCPLIAAQSGDRWSGKWRKLNYSTHQSVCEVISGAAPTVQSQTVVTTKTTYVNLNPTPAPVAANVREVFAGPIWDGNQANTKCPIIAANNKGTWTGKWRKTGPDHSSLCEVRF